jgi:hypothetical protein
MTSSSVRSTTANTGKTVLALVAIFSLLLSLFAIARPVIANHDDGVPEVTPTRDITRENEGGNIQSCADPNATMVDFPTAGTGGSQGGVTYTITDGKLTFIADPGILVAEALIKGGAGTNIYDYTGASDGFAGPGIAHDDGLVGPLGAISNVAFCVIPQPTGDLVINKTDGTGPLAGVTFTLDGDNLEDPIVDVTDLNGVASFEDLLPGTYTLTETKPDGFEPMGPWTVTVAADGTVTIEGLTANEDGSFTIVNVPEEELGGLTITKVGDCEDCDTFTRGKFFNRGEGSFNTDSLFDANSGGAISIPGTGYSFTDEADVQAYIDSDVDDPLTEQAVVQYVTTVLNVRYNLENNEGCDLGSQIYSGSVEAFTTEPTTVNEILEAAAATLAGNGTVSLEDVKNALDEINNSGGDGEGEEDVLECAGGETGGGLAGVTFELYLDDGDGEFDDGDTEITEGGPFVTGENGELTIPDLEAGDYFLVEVDRPAECGALEAPIVFGPFTVEAGVTTVVSDPLVNDCDDDGEEEEFDFSLVKENQDGTPMGAIEFNLTNDDDYDQTISTSAGGTVTFTGLTEGEYTLTENDTTCTNDGPWTVSVAADGTITVTDSTETVLDSNLDGSFTIVNTCEEDENGLVEIDKLFCFTDNEEGSTEFFFPGEVDTLGAEDELPETGCWTEAVSFTITGGDLEEPLEVMTDANGSLEFTLPLSENLYTITEDLSGESAQFLVDSEFTVILVLNLIPQEEDTGLVKVIKLFCEGDEASVEFIVEGEDAPVPLISGCELGDATFELGDMEIETTGGLAVVIADVGSYTFAETDPNEATYDGTIVVEEGEITTIIVINTFEEGENPSEGGPGPGQGETPRENTAGGNPLPNTATSPIPTGSVPAALLALLMLAGLGAAGYAVRAEAQRRR